MAGGFVRVRSPDGRSLAVPEENLGRFVEAGYQPDEAPELAATAPADVPSVDVAPAPAPAPEAPAAPQYVRMTAPDGRVIGAPVEHLERFRANGYQTDDELEQGGLLGKIQTFGEGIAKGVSLGATTPIAAAEAAGAYLADRAFEAMRPEGEPERPLETYGQMFDRAAADIATRAAVNPGTSMAGQAFGAVTTALATGGASALAKGAALAPAGLAARGAGALAGAVAARVAPTAVRGLLRPAVGLLAQGAIEGAGYGAIEEVDRAFQAEDWDGIAAKVFGSAASGALVGAGMSLGVGTLFGAGAKLVGGAGRLAGKVGGKQAAAEAAPDALEQANAAAQRVELAPIADPVAEIQARGAQAAAAPADQSIVQGVIQRARASGGKLEDALEQEQGELKKLLDQFLEDDDAVRDSLMKHAKRAHLAEQLNGQDLPVTPADAVGVLENLRAKIGALRAKTGDAALGDGGGATALAHVESLIDDATERVVQHVSRGEYGDAFMVLDDFKTSFGARAKRTRNSIAQDFLRREYEPLAKYLEDETRWGIAAVEQKPINRIISERIALESDPRLNKLWSETGKKRPTDLFELQSAINEEGLATVLGRLGDKVNEPTEQAFRKYLRSAAMDAEQRAVTWGGEAAIATAKRMKAISQMVESRLDALTVVRKEAKTWEKAASRLDLPVVGWAIKGAGKLASSAEAISPTVGQAKTTQVAHEAARAQQRINRAARLGALLERGEKGALRAGQRARQVMTYAAVTSYVDSLHPSSPKQRQFERDIRDLEEQAPGIARALAAKNEAQRAFVLARVPTAAPGGLGEDPMVDRESLARATRAIRAAEDPIRALERVAGGDFDAEDLELLTEVHPELLAELRAKAADRLQRMRKEASFDASMRAMGAMGLPTGAAADPVHAAWLQGLAQGAQAAREGEPPAELRGAERARKMKTLAESYETRTARVLR